MPIHLDLDSHALRVVRAVADHGTHHRRRRGRSATASPRSASTSNGSKPASACRSSPASAAGSRLTEAGRVLARHASTVTTALDAAAGELADLSGLRSGRVRLAAFPSASSTIVPRLLADDGGHASRRADHLHGGRTAGGRAVGAHAGRRPRDHVQLPGRPRRPAPGERARARRRARSGATRW